MVSKKEPEQKQGGMKRILAAIAIIATALFLLAAAAPAAAPESSMQPAASVSNYTPAPTMNTNVTWSLFKSGWSPLEYSNGTDNLTLNADMSSFYANPISIQTQDIQAPGILQNDTFGSSVWNTKAEAVPTPANGAVSTVGTTTINSITEPYFTLNATEAGATSSWFEAPPYIEVSQLPSENPAYDFLTFGVSLSGQPLSGAYAALSFYNGTSNPYAIQITPGQTIFESVSLAQLTHLSNGAGFNITGKGAMSELQIQTNINLPKAPGSDTFKLTLFAESMTEYPITLGENATGGIPTSYLGAATLASFHPSVPMNITSNGYSVAVSQPLQNTTEQQTSINDGSYTEQATYQGIFSLPSAPDLSYSASNITVPLYIPGSQYEVANLNGASYLSTLQTQTNGTFAFGTVNPNAQNSLVIETKYTTAQWDASSSPPSFFSLAGIEYYWWVALLGFMGLIGLGSVAMSHFGGEEETLRVPKGKFGR